MRIEAPNRRRHAFTQRLDAPPERVFPLLCPVREIDWTPGWNPELILTSSGVAEQDCVFVLPGVPHPAIWVTTRYAPETWELQFLRVAPEHTVCRIDIALAPLVTAGTAAEIVYAYTSLGPAGDAFLEGFTDDWYRRFMEAWERALNHYLTTGARIEG